jgi:uncharacterized protein YecT (DUF1311 family)
MRALVFAVCLIPGIAGAACEGIDDFLAELECLDTEYKRVDAALNAAWPKVLANPPSGSSQGSQRERIRTSQRAWIAYRDADCEAKADVGIPKYEHYNRLICLIGHTDARMADLLETYAN